VKRSLGFGLFIWSKRIKGGGRRERPASHGPAESLEVIQETSAAILAALEPKPDFEEQKTQVEWQSPASPSTVWRAASDCPPPGIAWESNSRHTAERIGQLPMMDKMGDVEDLARQAVASAAAAGTESPQRGRSSDSPA
jgi:hypothetical protein